MRVVAGTRKKDKGKRIKMVAAGFNLKYKNMIREFPITFSFIPYPLSLKAIEQGVIYV